MTKPELDPEDQRILNVIKLGYERGIMGMHLMQIAGSVGFGVMSSEEVHRRLLDMEQRKIVRCDMANPETIQPLWMLT